MNLNRQTRRSLIATTLTCMLLGILTFQAPAKEGIEIIDAFIDHVEKSDSFDDKQRIDALEVVKELREDSYNREIAITEGLARLYPNYAQVLEVIASGDDLVKATSLLDPFTKSEDRYLAADATYYLARANAYTQQYEQALPSLDQLLEKHSDHMLQEGSVMYLKGITEAGLLKRDEAKKSFQKFLTDYPESSERMKVNAWRQLQLLQMVEDGTIGDAFQRMEYSRRRLALENSNEETQKHQGEIVDILAQLIKKAEEQESSSSSSNTKGDPGESKPEQSDKPGDQKGQGQSQVGGGSNNPDGVVRRTFGDGPTSPWSRLRDRARDPAFSTLKEKYPARYQKMIEQYYKSFQNGTPKK